MTIGVVQHVASEMHGLAGHSSHTLAWSGATTAGNTLYAWATAADTGVLNIEMDEVVGWAVLYHGIAGGMDAMLLRKSADGTETDFTLTFTNSLSQASTIRRSALTLIEVNGVHENVTVSRTASNPLVLPTITPTGGVEALVLALSVKGNAHGITINPAGYSALDEVVPNDGSSERFSTWYRHESSTSGSYSASITYSGAADRAITAQVWLSEIPPVGISIDADPQNGVAPLSVDFTSTAEGGTPSAYLWDFGDGDTATTANPTHIYTDAALYTVTLTATIGGVDYVASLTVHIASDVGYVPLPPGRAILEIKATPPGAARWDEVNWDEAYWSEASWQDVTPYGVEVQILWGSSRPELGILSTPDAATWAITFYDPLRILDPANADSPYAGDIQPYLPVRLRHNETVIKQGVLESASHTFEDDTGYWRVMDIQATLANAVVPSDVTLADTLFQRARDAIAAAGLAITVAPDPPGGDPALAPWASQEWTAWQWISDAAQQVLWVPYVTNVNALAFRDYQNPMVRGRSIGSPNLEGLQSIVMHNGMFSIVGALELVSEGTDIVRRELTPKPRYGAREYLRTEPTPDSGDWAQAVLNDRTRSALRWLPAKVIPFTANETAYFATIEALEQISIDYPEADPAILADGIVVGGEIHVIGKKDEVPIWDFLYHVAQIPLQPLTDDDDVSSYLTNDDDASDILYPDV